ncbi:MAG: exonuclease domain-containing protein [Anaerolineales bacterium]|jgi:DNA polymerase-3 subunit epsilon
MSLLEAQLEAQNLLQLNPLFLHSKTTGADELSEVVEIAILDSAGNPLADALVKPKRHIRPNATDVHGITDDMVDNAPKWSEILPMIEELLIGKKVCVYDPASELLALQNSYQNNHNRWVLDSDNFYSLMDLFSRYKNQRDPHSGVLLAYSLEDASHMLGIDIEIIGFRRAHEDAWLMRALLLAIAGWKVYY